jgi:Uma2 family endonuclease
MSTLNLDMNKRYTFADYLTWWDDKRRELIDGFVHKMTPAPVRKHQKISFQFTLSFGNYLLGKKCEVYHAPFDVRLPKNRETEPDKIYNVVQPDITVVCDPDKLDEKGCIGAPDLIVEIISKSSAKRDMKDKYNLYEESGVREYWIAFPEENAIYKFVLSDAGKYELEGMYVEGDIIKPHIFPDLEMEISKIFED